MRQLALALEGDDTRPPVRLELEAAYGSTVLADGRRVWWRDRPVCIDLAWPAWTPGPVARVELFGVR